jgi:peptidoglycan hydrolase CwlO-like protein
MSATASTTGDRVASTRHAIDDIAQKWFAAQDEAASIDARIAEIEHRIADAEARVDATRKIASARAVMLYKTSEVALTSVFGSDALDAARRSELANQANQTSQDAIDQLVAAVHDLKSQHKSLEAQRSRERLVIADVGRQRDQLDAQLATLRDQARAEAQAAVTAASTSQARAAAANRLNAFVTPAAPRRLSSIAPPTAPTPPVVHHVRVSPSSGGRVSSHHRDPFLTCTRARESAGIYSINTGNGYYGAYQFLPSTWDATAAHGGRTDLVGLLPSRASAYDQDEVAWILYQWQGKGPWGGRC